MKEKIKIIKPKVSKYIDSITLTKDMINDDIIDAY